MGRYANAIARCEDNNLKIILKNWILILIILCFALLLVWNIIISAICLIQSQIKYVHGISCSTAVICSIPCFFLPNILRIIIVSAWVLFEFIIRQWLANLRNCRMIRRCFLLQALAIFIVLIPTDRRQSRNSASLSISALLNGATFRFG